MHKSYLFNIILKNWFAEDHFKCWWEQNTTCQEEHRRILTSQQLNLVFVIMKVWLYKFSSKTSFSSWKKKKTPKICPYKCRVLSISMCNTCMFYQLKDADISITFYYWLPLIFHFATNYWNHYINNYAFFYLLPIFSLHYYFGILHGYPCIVTDSCFRRAPTGDQTRGLLTASQSATGWAIRVLEHYLV